MRFTHENAERGFKVPFGQWLIPISGSLFCMLLMKGVSLVTLYRFLVWTGLGQIIYFSYGYWHSKQRQLRIEADAISVITLPPNIENNENDPVPNVNEIDLAASTLETAV